ncbi:MULTISPECIES: LytTR family transcriptional regulator DNA-binding domain-containing protein [Paenibacillus]|uniref:HTH LytTR-type domain-containing protein n=1 Tax=Paenibacillus radicis (ex Gao et al. 2016) TaxID=1737354 RepID=A0A917GZG9_9BACL|nr:MULTISPECIES: LytTR family transcriptional regulator DNA-binding domain-containing protein [Paenibacillus]GGG62838.1 hypothetical protein GCM10010918_15820 [Paenibacillus radicis (ex Gao et al. 2016)]
MMNSTLSGRNVYEDFDLESDVLFFKIGSLELVSFHGRNYNIKKRMTAEQIQKLTQERSFFQVSSNIYINIGKIKSIAGGIVYFGGEHSECKQLPVPRRKQYVIQKLFMQRAIESELRITP